MTFHDFPTCSLNGPVTPPAVALAAVPAARPEAALVAAPEICWVPWLRYPGTKWRGVLELPQISECFSLERFSKAIHVYKQQRLRGQQCQHISCFFHTNSCTTCNVSRSSPPGAPIDFRQEATIGLRRGDPFTTWRKSLGDFDIVWLPH